MGETTLRLDRYDGVAQFLAVAEPFLASREAEHNLILGLAGTLRRAPDLWPEPPFLATVTAGSRVVGAALRTPPQNLLLSEVDDPQVVPLLAEAVGPELPGVTGPPEAARALAERWVRRFGGSWTVHLAERIYRLTEVRAPRPAPGGWRPATADDRPLLEAWLPAFQRDTFPADAMDPDGNRRRLNDWESGASGRRFWLWEDAGEPVSLVGAGNPTPNGIRVGPVYTPPERRGRGFASNLTAAVTAALLDEGRRFCFLYTDLANPTSNRIYQAIGYEPVTDALVLRFTES